MSVKAISCPNCGGGVELRGMSHTLSAVCVNCLSVLDASTPQVRVLQQFQEAARTQPKIPLGTRGKLQGHVWEAMGFQTRAIQVEGAAYSWDEYLLFNPYQGFRYLSEYNGHWNFIRPARGWPAPRGNNFSYEGRSYKHFQSTRPVTAYAMGEFPWRVRVNDEVWAADYTAPPYLLSCESTEGERTWSIGLYVAGAEVARAFSLAQPLPPAAGVFANQPNPHAVGTLWRTCLWLTIGLFAVMTMFGFLASSERIFARQYAVAGAESDAVTTPQFEIGGHGGQNVEVHAAASLSQTYLYLNLTLVNAASGEAYSAGRELETESSRATVKDSVVFSQVAPGRYYLRVEPDTDKNSPALRYGGLHYDVEVWRDVPHYLFFWLAVPLMALPAIFATFRKSAFETARWQESDHAS